MSRSPLVLAEEIEQRTPQDAYYEATRNRLLSILDEMAVVDETALATLEEEFLSAAIRHYQRLGQVLQLHLTAHGKMLCATCIANTFSAPCGAECQHGVNINKTN